MCGRPALRRVAFTRRELGRAAMLGWLGSLMKTGAASGAASIANSSDSDPWRADFPALDQNINGSPLIYLDSAATTHRPRQVLAAMNDFYEHDNANPGSALHALARRAYER